MGIDDEIENILRDESPTTKAVKSLIEVKDREAGKHNSEIELKTDLDSNQICIHTAVSVMNNVLEQSEKDFGKSCILGNLLEIKERKLLSKDRKSRQEIVNVARQPDMNAMNVNDSSGFVSNLFKSRKDRI